MTNEADMPKKEKRLFFLLDAEKPQKAFLRRSQPEAIVGWLLKWGDCYVVKWIRQAQKYLYATDKPVLVGERGEMFSEEEEAKEKGFYYGML